MPVCAGLVFIWLNNKFGTLIIGRGVINSEASRINILPMLDIHLLIIIPSNSKSFAFTGLAGGFVKRVHVVWIRCWFLFGVAKGYLRNGFFVTFAKGAWFVHICWRQLRFNNISMTGLRLLKSFIFRERIAVGSMSPSGCGLRPSR